MNPNFENIEGKPLLAYPCRWQYTAIGLDEDLVRAAIAEIVADLDHSLHLSNVSRHGKYCSLILAVTVTSEEQRNDILVALRGHRDIRMVL